MKKLILAVFALLVAISVAACNGNTVTGPSPNDPPNPTPTPGNPSGTPMQVDTYIGDIGLDDPAVCEPYPAGSPGSPSGFQVCRMVSFTAIRDGFMEIRLEWSPKDPNARNWFVFYGATFGRSGSPMNSPIPNGRVENTSRPVVAGQSYAFGMYVVPGGEGRSNFTLTVGYPK